MLPSQLVFYKDDERKIIDEDKTNKYLKSTNELFNHLVSNDPSYGDLVKDVIVEIVGVYNLAINDYKNYTDNSNNIPKSVSPIIGVRPKMFNENDVKQMKELKEKGLSHYKIAAQFGCSEKTIRNYLKY